jgi:hypothetical protein
MSILLVSLPPTPSLRRNVTETGVLTRIAACVQNSVYRAGILLKVYGGLGTEEE